MHIANAFALIENDEGDHDIFDRFEPAARSTIRKMMIALVVATDMAHHNTVMQSFKNEIHSSSELERTATARALAAAQATGSIGYGAAGGAAAPKKLTTLQTIDAMLEHTGADMSPAINLASGDNALKTMKMCVGSLFCFVGNCFVLSVHCWS